MVNAEDRHRRYPRWFRRVEAVLIDGVILALACVGAGDFISSTDIDPVLKIAFVAFFPIFLEPGLVSSTGGTIGHHLRGLRVERADTGGKLGFFHATVRFVVKVILGWWSLILIVLTKRHQAVHDLAARCVVVLVNPSRVKEGEALPERVIEEKGFWYPSRWQRAFFILVYMFGSFLIGSALFALLVSAGCLHSSRCTAADEIIQTALSVGWLIAVVAIVVFGWKCRLWGCRRRLRRSNPSPEDRAQGA